MTGTVRIHVVAVSDSGLLCRMLGYWAQLDLPAPELIVRHEGSSMVVDLSCPDFDVADIVARRIAGLFGVERVDAHRDAGKRQGAGGESLAVAS